MSAERGEKWWRNSLSDDCFSIDPTLLAPRAPECFSAESCWFRSNACVAHHSQTG